MNVIKRVPFHPLIFAGYPVLAMVAANLKIAPPQKIFRAIGVVYLSMLILLGILWLMIRNMGKAGAITSLILVLFFTYGHVYDLAGVNADPTLWLSVIWFIIFMGGIRWTMTHPGMMPPVTQILNVISVVLLLFPLVTVSVYTVRTSKESPQTHEPHTFPPFQLERNVEAADSLPDIYLIILDGYARADVLTEIYDYDNQPLLNFLETRGFFIADESFANYHHTVLSLPSTLNMTYTSDLIDYEPGGAYDYWELVGLIRENWVFDLAAEAGYSLVAFDSYFTATQIHKVDHYVYPKVEIESTGTTSNNTAERQFQLTLFEIKLLETTALRPLLPMIFKNADEDSRYELHRQHIQHTFSNLARYARKEGAHFVFAHIIAPHPPFVFDADGEPKPNWRLYTVADGSHWIGRIGTRGEYIEWYRDQVDYVNSMLMTAIEDILTESEIPPVIIIQSDHGPGAYFNWSSTDRTNLTERMGILNAFYFPGGDQGWLYPSISPVNTFRVVFNRYLGQDFELLDDRAFFIAWRRPYHFTDVTERLNKVEAR